MSLFGLRKPACYAVILGVMRGALDTLPEVAADEPDERIDIAGLKVALWKPPSGAGPFPLVL